MVKNKQDRTETVHITKRIMTLPANILKSDAKFQRDINKKRVADIATNFDLSKWDFPIIKIINGEYQIQDGQHRVAAIITRFGPDSLIDCFVEDGVYQDAALGFAQQDVGKKTLSKYDRFNANVEGGSPRELDILRVLNTYGLTFASTSKSKVITAVGLCEKIYDSLGAHGLSRILKIITESFGYDKEALSSSVIKGVAAFRAYYDEGADYQMNVLIAQLKKANLSTMMIQASKKVCKQWDNSFALEMVREYNKGVKKDNNKLDPGKLFMD